MKEFFECSFKGGLKISGEISDKAYRVTKQNLLMMGKSKSTRGHMERREELIFRKDLTLSDRIKKGAFACVCVPYKGHLRHTASLTSATLILALNLSTLEVTLKPNNAVSGSSPINLEFRLTGSTPSDPSREAREGAVLVREPRK